MEGVRGYMQDVLFRGFGATTCRSTSSRDLNRLKYIGGMGREPVVDR